MYSQTRKEYTGPYIILSDGVLFAGNDINKVTARDIIIPIQEDKKDNTYVIMDESKIGGSVPLYSLLNPNRFKEQDNYQPIVTTKPTPTKEDYIKGFFYRYVAKRRNSEVHYYEIDKDTYNSIFNEEKKYDDSLHVVKKIKWDLTEKSGKTNNMAIRKIAKTTSLKKLGSFFDNFQEYQLPTELLKPQISPENINSPKLKLPTQTGRNKVIEAQKEAIDLIKERARKKYNKASDIKDTTSQESMDPSELREEKRRLSSVSNMDTSSGGTSSEGSSGGSSGGGTSGGGGGGY